MSDRQYDHARFDALEYEDKQSWMRTQLLPIAQLWARGSRVALPEPVGEGIPALIAFLADITNAQDLLRSLEADHIDVEWARFLMNPAVAARARGLGAEDLAEYRAERLAEDPAYDPKALVDSVTYDVDVDMSPTADEYYCHLGRAAAADSFSPVAEGAGIARLDLNALGRLSRACQASLGAGDLV